MKRALICEDDPAIRNLVSTVVRREGFDIEQAEDGEASLQKIRSGCFDLLLVDLMMPGIDGRAVISYLESEQPDRLKRVVVMTAASGVTASDFPAPVCTVLSKPFDIDELRDVVRSCAARCEGTPAASPP